MSETDIISNDNRREDHKTFEKLSEEGLIDTIEIFIRKFWKEIIIYDEEDGVKTKQKIPIYLKEIAAFKNIRRIKRHKEIITDKTVEDITTAYLNISYQDIAFYATIIDQENGNVIVDFIEKDIDGFLRCAKKAVLNILTELDREYAEQIKDRLDVSLNNYEKLTEITELGVKNNDRLIHTELIPISIDGIPRETIKKKCFRCGAGHENFVNPDIKIKKCREIGCEDPIIVEEDKDLSEKIDYISFTGQQRNERAFNANSQDIECKIFGYEKLQMFISSVKPGDVLSLDAIMRSDYSLDKRNIIAERYLEIVSFQKQKENNLFKKDPETEFLVRQKPADPVAFYWKCVRSMSPNIFGEVHVPIKQAILALVIGNKPRRDFNRTRYRGDFNFLIVSSPSSGKTEYGNYVLSVVPKSHYASSLSSKSGFTVGAYISEKNRRLTFGVIPLSDGAVVVIDEVDKLTKEEHNAMIECMDDNQMLNYNKAGFSKQILTRCGHLHLCNSNKNNGDYNPYVPFYEQVDLQSALLSRYDLIFVIPQLTEKDNSGLLDHFYKVDKSMMGEDEYEKMSFSGDVSNTENSYEMDVFDKKFIIHLRDYLKSIPYKNRPTLISGSPAWIRANKWILDHKNAKHLRFLEDPEAANNPDIIDFRKRRTIQNIAEHVVLIMRDSNKVEMHHMEITLNLMEASLASLIPKSRGDLENIQESQVRAPKDYNWFEKLPDHLKQKVAEDLRIVINKHVAFIKAIHKMSYQKCKVCNGSGYIGEMDANNIMSNPKQCWECKGAHGIYNESSYNDLKSYMVDLQQVKPVIYPAEFDQLLSTMVENDAMKLLRSTRTSGNTIFYKPTEYLLSPSVTDRIYMMLDPLNFLKKKSRSEPARDEEKGSKFNIKPKTKSAGENASSVDTWLARKGLTGGKVKTDRSLGTIVDENGVPVEDRRSIE